MTAPAAMTIRAAGRRLRLGLTCAPLALAACTTGPHDAHGVVTMPPAPQSSVIAPASGPAQSLQAGAVVGPAWWHRFGSADIDALVDRALAANNDLAAAEASLRQASALAAATRGDFGPQADLGFTSQRARTARSLSPVTADNRLNYTLHTAQLSISYPVDLFGAGRTAIRSARAAAAAAAAQRDAARTMLVANLVVAVIDHAATEAQIEAATQCIASNRAILALLQRRQALGEIGAADVAAQQTALATAEAALPPLEQARSHLRGLILTLIGQPAGSPLPPLPTLAAITLPSDLPVSLPADLVARRPDIRAAEAQLQGAAADVGQAIAARLPSLTLSGNAGGSAQSLDRLFGAGNPFFAVIGGVTQPLFHAGALRQRQKAAEAAYDAAKAQYRAAALQAFLDLDDALAALRADAAALDAATRAREAAAQALRFTRRQAELGAVGSLALLNAQSSDAQAAQQLVQARAARLTDSVALFQASGTDSAAR